MYINYTDWNIIKVCEFIIPKLQIIIINQCLWKKFLKIKCKSGKKCILIYPERILRYILQRDKKQTHKTDTKGMKWKKKKITQHRQIRKKKYLNIKLNTL